MTDTLSKPDRSRTMAAVKSHHTTPERVVRRLLHGLGYRFRLHARRLPGCPDIVLARHSAVINVHGCFWHRHACPAGRSTPASHCDYWQAKFARNQRRDRRVRAELRRLGWRVLTVWECQTTPQRRKQLERRVLAFLKSP